MFQWLNYLGGALMGWGLGANDSSNAFGTAVSSRMVSYRLAIAVTAIFVMAGALLQGQAGIKTFSRDLKGAAVQSDNLNPEQKDKAIKKAMKTGAIISFSAAVAVIVMTVLKMPVSTSQAVVGSIVGIGVLQDSVNFSALSKVVICWIGTPLGAALFTYILYKIFKSILRAWNPSIFVYDPVMRIALVVCGAYGAYALGANNVANVSAVFVGDGMMTEFQAAIFGGICIALGVLTFSKPVMMTVGKGVVELNAFTAFIVVLSEAITVHIYAMVGVPVSSSQAVIGALAGLGMIKGAHVINYKMLGGIAIGWITTPLVAAIFAILAYILTSLKYIP